jgi:uncharacterized protein (DUF2267 family)
MDEIVKQVSKRAGISEEQARQAVETVMRFLRERLPEPIAGQVQKVLEGGKVPDVGDLGKQLGGLLGKK